MKRSYWGTILFALVLLLPVSTKAAVNVNIEFPLPPPIVFPAPPVVIPMPETNDVYVAPDLAVDMFFWNGWWWRPWEGRWYRSRYYDRGWGFYDKVPGFYFDVDPSWRRYYRERNWNGHPWNYERVTHQNLMQNWKGWHTSRYWERQSTWGVKGYQPRPPHKQQEVRYQRQQQYQQRPEVQRHQQQMKERQRQQEVQQHEKQHHEEESEHRR